MCVWVTPETWRDPRRDCFSKFVGELGTVNWASEGSHSVSLRQIFLRKSGGSLSHIYGLEKFTCVADGGSDVLRLDNSVVSVCGNTQLQGGCTYTARGALGYVLGVGDTEQTFSRQPDGVVSGTQPGGEPVRCPAPKGDSENSEDMCSDSADARSCGVSWASGYSIVEDPALGTRMTTDSGTDGGLLTSEPQVCANLCLGSSVASDCDGTLYGHTWAVSCASGHVASDMDDAVFKCQAPPGFPDGTLPRCELLVCTGGECRGHL